MVTLYKRVDNRLKTLKYDTAIFMTAVGSSLGAVALNSGDYSDAKSALMGIAIAGFAYTIGSDFAERRYQEVDEDTLEEKL